MTTGKNTPKERTDTCRPLLDACTSLLYRKNAFRITGLHVEASVREIKRRTDDLRHADAAGDAEAEHSHAFALDPVPDLELVRDAARRLNDPELRLIEEFFWFWPARAGRAKDDPALLALADDDKQTSVNIWRNALSAAHSEARAVAMHNLAVMFHMRALDGELLSIERCASPAESRMDTNARPQASEQHLPLPTAERELRATIDEDWRTCFQWWEELASDDVFWRLVSERIRALDDPRVTTGFARRMRATIPEALDKVNASLAMQYLDYGDVASARTHITYMNQTHQGLDNVPKTLGMVTSPLQTRIRDAVAKTSSAAERDSSQTAEVARELLTAVAKPLKTIAEILPSDDPDRIALCDSVAECVNRCAVIHGNETESWETCTSLLEASLGIAESVHVKKRVQENLEVARQNAAQQEIVERLSQTRSGRRASDRERRATYAVPSRASGAPASSHSGTWWLLVSILAVAALAVVVSFVNLAGGGDSSSTPSSPGSVTISPPATNDTLLQEIETGKWQLAQYEAQLQDMEDRLDQLDRTMTSLSAQGQIERYNALVPKYNSLLEEYNALYNRYSRLFDEVNAKIDLYNAG